MARPLHLVVEELLDYIEQARAYARNMTFEQYFADQKTRRAVERCIEVISEASRHIPDAIMAKHPQIPWSDVAGIGNIFRRVYHNVAARIVWDTVRVHLPQLAMGLRAQGITGALLEALNAPERFQLVPCGGELFIEPICEH